jgi:hypothetical protein
LDTVSEYGLKLYYPFINLWQYWESQSNANADFYPDQNKDWHNYSSATDWNVRLYFGLENENQVFERVALIPILDYEDGNTTPSIEYFRENGDPCTALVDGEIMTIRVKHTTATALNPDTIWAQITAEPFEASSRWITSTVIGNGNDPLNPLSNDVTITIVGLDTFIECTIDTNKINIQNGVSIGSRIFGTDEFEDLWLTTDGDLWLTTSGDKFVII